VSTKLSKNFLETLRIKKWTLTPCSRVRRAIRESSRVGRAVGKCSSSKAFRGSKRVRRAVGKDNSRRHSEEAAE
jgi:hypothetical protein